MDRMMEFEYDRSPYEELPYEAQVRIFLNFAERDPAETLYFRYLYFKKPYALRILKKAAMGDPEVAISLILKNPYHPNYVALKKYMDDIYGNEAVEKGIKASGFTVINRIKVYGLLKGLFAIDIMKPLEDVA